MPQVTHRVMIVDRDETNIEILQGMLEDDFEISSLSDESNVFEKVQTDLPDLILMDTGVPEAHSYEICSKIKSDKTTEHCSVVFLCEQNTLEQKMAGYEAGCDDYISKPYDPQELLTRLRLQIQTQKQQSKLRSDAQNAMDAAFAAMQNSSEIGSIVRFLEHALECQHFDDIGNSLLTITKEFGLMCAVQIRSLEGVLNYGCNNKSVEAKMLSELKDKGKIIDFGARTLINYAHISLLVRNMPLNEKENYGRIKDNLVLLINSCEAKVKTLNNEITLQEQRDGGILSIISECHDELTDAAKQIKFLDNLIDEVMEWQRRELEDKLIVLGLSEEQEEALLEMVENSVEKLQISRNIGEEIDDRFARIIQQLTQIIEIE